MTMSERDLLKRLEMARIAIWGLGREGLSACRFLRRHFPDKKLLLVNEGPPDADLLRSDPGLDYVPEADLVARAGDLDLLIKSPGISLYREEVTALKKQGVTVTSCTNIWFALDRPGQVIAVTGSNGKSTTASLLQHILSALGHESRLGGNIGRPLLDLMAGTGTASAGPEIAYWVLELSSYQTADLDGRPDLAVLLNLFPEHIQWHHSHDAYYRDKLNLLRDPAVPAVLNHRDKLTRHYLGTRKTVLWFNHPDGLHVADDTLYRGTTLLGSLKDFPLPGAHNRENLCAALAACDHLGLDLQVCLGAALTFTGLPHRLEPLGRLGRHDFVNDSIATTPEATAAALAALERVDLCLIIGGQDRQQEYRELARLITARKIQAVITAYETGDRIYDALQAAGYEGRLEKATSLVEAVSRACRITPAGGMILLSPAAPSYDAFQNFEQRGEAFRAAAKKPA